MTQAMDEKQEAKEKAKAAKARNEAMAEKEKALNAGKTGVGLRSVLSVTRGKNPQEIQFEAFDVEQPETLPTDITKFAEIAGFANDKDYEQQLVRYAILGYNEDAYTTASDPVAEFVNPAWDKDVKLRFKTIIRNYSRDTGATIEDAVALIKPGIEAAEAKRIAALSVGV